MGAGAEIHIVLLKTMNLSKVKEAFSVAEQVCFKI